VAQKYDSAEKRLRQSKERHLKNKAAKTALRTSAKKVLALVQKKDGPGAQAALKDMVKRYDTAAGKGIIKKNAASRKKSRMQKLCNTLLAAAG
jgi:small subunit ribosomal protein S20